MTADTRANFSALTAPRPYMSTFAVLDALRQRLLVFCGCQRDLETLIEVLRIARLIEGIFKSLRQHEVLK